MCEVTPTPPLNITMVKINNGSRQQGHVRYPNTKDTLKINEERGKTSWETPPIQITMQKKNKNEKEQKAVVKQPCPSLQEDLESVQVCAR